MRIASNSKKFDSGVGFSNGCAELTLKNPPPLVPNCLMAICEAAGPIGSVTSVTGLPSAPVTGCTSVAVSYDLKFWMTPCDTRIKATDQRQRQQDIDRGAYQVVPEVADRGAGAPRQSANQCHQHRNAAGRREKVLHSQPQHLRQVAHRRFAAVALPIRVGGEAGRRVEGQIRAVRGKTLRVERQNGLQAQQ